MAKQAINVTKYSGEAESYDVNKLRQSLLRSNAKPRVVDEIVRQIEGSIYEGISTSEIYKMAFKLLRKGSRHTAARYKLKKAIMELGPTGFPFEKFVGKILDYLGYTTRLGVVVKGHCVSHEIDVIAEKADRHFMVECKFHADQSRNCNVKIPLYIQSRFLDVEKVWQERPGHETKFHQGWIVTNTRFTGDAIKYGECMGLSLVGWNYPAKGSLKELLDSSGLHPLTCLTTLTRAEKEKLLNKGKVLCKELCEDPRMLTEIGIRDPRRSRILGEAQQLCYQ
jgi:hypothetical protein